MAKRTVYDCDNCGKQACITRTISLIVDRKADGAGSMEDWTEEVDLCIDCIFHALNVILDKLNYQESRDWISKMRKMRK